ncbi:hypothetical protein BJ875DRAFT_504274 [Amylocarpus encephaloides]|uniref:Uncharacterized protein n=1 Tax=Amylocarpus encephaloides TaxID=45428 RepID=A0A9P8C5U2_9HELO|nr:hypothetical protein BJ875DRAFT_504274 [Amylocarpus encephaloides]
MEQMLNIKQVRPPTPVKPPSKKRKTRNEEEADEAAESAAQNAFSGFNGSKPKRPRKKKEDPSEEKRLKRFREKAPLSYLERLSRVRTQRMFLIDRERSTSEDGGHEEERFDIAGTTGNVYQVTISKVPTCSCPDSSKGNQCKHIIYVLVNVLKAREDLAYQLAFLSTELAEIFASAPATPQSSESSTSTETGGHRKPIEGDCPVCVMEFDDSDKPEDILWCKAACGNNIHRHCFERWAKSKPGEVRCVFCRTPWNGDEDSIKRIAKSGGKVGADGYVNVAGELGLSGHRDTSSYHQPWAARQYGSRW